MTHFSAIENMLKQNAIGLRNDVIAHYAYQIYTRKRERNQPSTPEQDWQESIDYLANHKLVVLSCRMRSLLRKIVEAVFIGLPSSRWIQLLAVPLILSVSGAILASFLQENSRQYSILEKYLQDSEALLSDSEKNLSEHDKQVRRSLFRTRSIAIINGFNGENKQIVIRLLSELDLINKSNGGISLAGLSLKMARLDNLRLDEADLRGTNLSGALISTSTLRSANLSRAVLDRSNMQGSSLVAADLSWASLRGAIIGFDYDLIEFAERSERRGMPASNYLLSTQARLAVDLERAVLENANLEDANLRGANLREARLRSAKLINSNLQTARLENANIREADLRGASLRGALLNNAQLDLANLENADLKDAVLLDATGLTVAQLKRARNWEKATYSPLINSQLGLSSTNLH